MEIQILILVKFHLKLKYSFMQNTCDFYYTLRHLRVSVTFFMDTAQWLERFSDSSYKAYSVNPIARKKDSKLFVPLLFPASTCLIYNRQAMGRGQNRDTPIQGNTVLFFPVPCSSFCPYISMRHEAIQFLCLVG